MQKQFIEIAVGIFVVAGFGALLFLAFKVGNLNANPVSDPYTIRAYFDNIGGLRERATVTMAGVDIGRVRSIRLDGDTYRAVVEMEISGDYRQLPTDTSASIATQGMLGEQYVSLEPGGEPVYLKEGDRIRLTQSAVVLENLIGQLLFSRAADGGN
jgi:phospholipid/cholesterol/gamma-HCH transport system substrate-binding protein